MFLRFGNLFVEFAYGGVVALFDGKVAETWIHFSVFIGFALDCNFQRARRSHLCFRVQQVEVAEGVHDFLIGGVLEDFRDIICSGLAGEFGEITVLDMGHRFAGEGSLEVFDGD
ncbi:MAG: hypothetical protein JWR22_991 [Herminiimonas sp.]|nr:hypothetical protein [Herminiimonas sp.]